MNTSPQVSGGYPRPRGRGPIEAADAEPRPVPSSPIRDLAVAAPLKRVRQVIYIANIRCYPRPRGRGPIEASGKRAHETACPTYPRPRGRGPIEARVPCLECAGPYPIRDLAVAAPLKQGSEWLDVAWAIRYPRPRGRGPIEAKRSDCQRRRRLSATSRSRPH